ncbi:MAG: porin [Candidatus Endonucleobacter bathymodioli]|uniref:Porin n=1 Tax=Candidatus Endonucleibacter bathymodioli TaxID=539814 RepID=A0AA90NX51_9GAMM|nr:porin [Candidatus Endonucleobacter bathymodioli]
MQKKLLPAIALFMLASQAIGLEVMNDGTSKVNIGGYLSLQTKTADGRTKVNNDSARINFAFEHSLNEAMAGFALVEWGYKAKNEYTITNNAGVLETKTAELFVNRLAYVGVKHSEYGSAAFGKQKSVYSDISGWTDQCAINGGNAVGLCNGITSDGGFSGTASRSDDAISYRIELGSMKLGAQYQLRDSNYNESLNKTPIDGGARRNYGYQVAASYTFDMGLSLGATYSETSLEAKISTASSPKGINSRAIAGGVKYIMDDLYLAATCVQFQNYTTTHASSPTGNVDNFGLDKKSEGFELFGRYKLSQLLDGGISLQASWNKLKVDEDNTSSGNTSSDAKIDKIMVGAVYELGPLRFALEYVLNNSKFYEGTVNNVKTYKDGDDYCSLQARYSF